MNDNRDPATDAWRRFDLDMAASHRTARRRDIEMRRTVDRIVVVVTAAITLVAATATVIALYHLNAAASLAWSLTTVVCAGFTAVMFRMLLDTTTDLALDTELRGTDPTS